MQCRMPNHEVSKPVYFSVSESMNKMKALMSKVKDEDQSSVLSLLYTDLAASKHSFKIPNDYLQLSMHAFKYLKKTVEQMFCTSLLKPLEKCVVIDQTLSFLANRCQWVC